MIFLLLQILRKPGAVDSQFSRLPTWNFLQYPHRTQRKTSTVHYSTVCVSIFCCLCLSAASFLRFFFLFISFSLSFSRTGVASSLDDNSVYCEYRTSSKGGGLAHPQNISWRSYPFLLNSERIFLVAKCGSFSIARIRIRTLFLSSSENLKFWNKKLGFEFRVNVWSGSGS